MKIAVLSDTHVRNMSELPQKLRDALGKVDMIVHLGDYVGYQVLAGLRALGEFRGVAGNMDPASILFELPDHDILDIQGKKIGLTHGNGSPEGIVERVQARFPRNIDVILYGHSHQAVNEVSRGILMFNPGSVTRPFPGNPPSFGILTIDDKGVHGEIVLL